MGMAHQKKKQTAPHAKTGRAGRMFLCMIGFSLVVTGGVFEWLMWRSYQQAKASRDWPQVEAMILRSEIEERQVPGSPREYRLHLLYGYSYDGKQISTNQFSPRGPKWTKKEGNVEAVRQLYPQGSAHSVWVNPAKPVEAILEHDSKAAGYTLWFPALFIVGGLGMIWGACKSGQGRA